MKFFIFYLCSGNPTSHRFVRFKEELKRRRIELVSVNVFKDFLLTHRGLININDGKAIEVNRKSACLVLANIAESHFVMNFLERQGMKSFWPSADSIKFSDKLYTSLFFESIGVTTPDTILLVDKRNIEKQIELIKGFPCVIKNVTGSEGGLVGLVRSKDEIREFIDRAFHRWFDENKTKMPTSAKVGFIVQEYIKEAVGVDYRVLCLENEIIGGIKRSSQGDDFRANVSLGGKAEVFEVPDDLAAICRKIMKEGKLFYAGIDFIKSKQDWMAIEINTCAQFKGFERATGINVAGKIIDRLLEKNKR